MIGISKEFQNSPLRIGPNESKLLNMKTKDITLNQNEVSVLRTLLRIYVDEQKELLEQRINDGRDKIAEGGKWLQSRI